MLIIGKPFTTNPNWSPSKLLIVTLLATLIAIATRTSLDKLIAPPILLVKDFYITTDDVQDFPASSSSSSINNSTSINKIEYDDNRISRTTTAPTIFLDLKLDQVQGLEFETVNVTIYLSQPHNNSRSYFPVASGCVSLPNRFMWEAKSYGFKRFYAEYLVWGLNLETMMAEAAATAAEVGFAEFRVELMTIIRFRRKWLFFFENKNRYLFHEAIDFQVTVDKDHTPMMRMKKE